MKYVVNNGTIKDKYGNNSDYIEIYNGNDYDINLYGYYLSDSVKNTRKWAFPDIDIKANSYLLIFASGKDETVLLNNSSGTVISKVYVIESIKDTSIGYNGKEYVYYYTGNTSLSSFPSCTFTGVSNPLFAIYCGHPTINLKLVCKSKDKFNDSTITADDFDLSSSDRFLGSDYVIGNVVKKEINNGFEYTVPVTLTNYNRCWWITDSSGIPATLTLHSNIIASGSGVGNTGLISTRFYTYCSKY